MRISGCIIARNEKDNIANCIMSLKNVTNEIIVVDTGSEDDTVQIAEDLGAFVFRQKWENDFSRAKNHALEHARGDWVIFLDADEYFHESSIPKVRAVIQKAHSNRNNEGILCEIVHIDKDNDKIISNDEVLRIFRNSKKIRYINKIHEEIRNSGVPLKCINVRNILSVMHTGYSASLLADKARRNLELIKSNVGDEKSAYYFATSYFILQDYENAYKYADSALSVDPIMARDSLAYKMYLIRTSVTLRTEYSNKEKIRRLIDEGNRKYGHHPEIAKIEATFLFSEKLYGEALEKYLYTLECQEKYGKTFEQNDFPGSVHEVYYNMAQILYLMNREADALEYYVKALRSNKYHSDAFSGMFALCGSLPENETVAFINSIYNVEREDDVRFVVARIAGCGRPRIVLYYANIWNNIFSNEDDVLIYALASQGNYSGALEIAMLYCRTDRDKYAPVAAAVMIMGQLFSEADKIKDEIGAEYFDLVRCYAGGDLFSGSKEAFANVFSMLAKHAGSYDCSGYLKIRAEMDAKTERNIAGIFLSNYRFGEAITYFDLTFESAVDEEMKASAAFQSGYCFYKLKQYGESVSRFEKAAMYGYAENDLTEFLRWISGQSADEAVKERAGALLASIPLRSTQPMIAR